MTGETGAGFKVQAKPCTTCIYRKDTHFDLRKLEAEIADPRMAGYFVSHRTCHHAYGACCRGFWNRHKDHFDIGQIVQRLGLVRFVQEETRPFAVKRRRGPRGAEDQP